MAGQREDLGAVTIGAREIYDELVAMREEVRSSAQSHESVAEELDDHEDRLRALERWKYSIPAALITALVSAAVTISTKVGA